jgi:drug/metabolite transporter (DMT)-like permease
VSALGILRPPARAAGHVYLGNVAATAMLSGIFVFGARSVRTSAPVEVAAQRFTLATLVFGLLFVARVIRPVRIRRASTGVYLLIASSAGVFLYNVLFFAGLDLSLASSGGLIIATIPVWTSLLESAVLGTRLTLRKVVGSLVSFSGVAYLFLASLDSSAGLLDSDNLVGDLLFLAAAVCWAVYSIAMKKVVAEVEPRVATAYSVGIGSVLLVVWSFLSNGHSPLNGEMLHIPIIYMATFGTVFALMLWFHSIQEIGPTRTSVFLNLVPVYTVVLAAVFLDESLGLSVLVALCIIIAGVLVVQTDPARA